MAILFIDICATRFGFINEKFVKKICQVLEIKLQHLIKLK